jgi:hypothetical protein
MDKKQRWNADSSASRGDWVELEAQTPVFACSYLPDQLARSQFAVPQEPLSAARYGELLRQGFRRSGYYIIDRNARNVNNVCQCGCGLMTSPCRPVLVDIAACWRVINT